MTDLPSIVAALVASLQAATAPYNFTGADAVKVGEFATEIPTLPFAAIETPQTKTVPWDARQRKWLHTATFTIRIWVPFTADTLGTRQAASIAVAEELAVALRIGRKSRQALQLVNSFVVEESALDPVPSTAPPDIVQTALVLSLSYVTAGGV